jgi:benzodiazapine receptor
MKKIQWKPLVISLLISLGTGAVSAYLTSDSMEQYTTLYKPPFAPPGWVFPLVWNLLFILMGVAAYRIYLSGAAERQQALKLYGIQLLVNACWSVIFFRFHAYLLAFAWLLLLWYLVWLTAKEFYTIDKTAGKLMIPYLIWLTFAGYLNLAIAVHYTF